jgi:hypothetical protein
VGVKTSHVIKPLTAETFPAWLTLAEAEGVAHAALV